MKTMPEFEHTLTMPDGTPVPALISVENRQVVVRPVDDKPQYAYLMQMQPVMDQAKQAVAERAGHAGQTNTAVAPTWQGPPSRFMPMIAENAAGSMVMELKKGWTYALIVWQGAQSPNMEFTAMNPGVTVEDVRADWERQGLTVLAVYPFVGEGQTIFIPAK